MPTTWEPLELPDDAIRLGPVAYQWTPEGHPWHLEHDGPCHMDVVHLMVWHDCDELLGLSSVEPGARFGWRPGRVLAHQVATPEPLTLSGSILWPECCGLHGWITDGSWVPA